VQFQIDMAVPPGSSYANDDRRKELMADALSGYFLAHDYGGNMRAAEITNFHQAAFSTGDCSVEDNDDHHGLPLQRQCAAIWGASLAASQEGDEIISGTSPILDPQVFVNIFNYAYEDMLKLDAKTCTLILEKDETETTTTSPSGIDGQPSLQEAIHSEGGNSTKETLPFEPDKLDLSWESRGKPDSKTPLPPHYSLKGETEEESTLISYSHIVGIGTPEEAVQSYMDNEEELDCDLPWVYCYFSSGHAQKNAYGFRLLFAMLTTFLCWGID
jgi:hypothetical protein